MLESFGYDRCMFAADWAVFEMTGKCNIVNQFDLTNKMVKKFFHNDQSAWNEIFCENGIKVYNLKVEKSSY